MILSLSLLERRGGLFLPGTRCQKKPLFSEEDIKFAQNLRTKTTETILDHRHSLPPSWSELETTIFDCLIRLQNLAEFA